MKSLHTSTFYHWQKKLKRLGRLPGFIPVIVDTSPGLSQDKFTDRHFSSSLVPPEESGVVPIEIEYPNKNNYPHKEWPGPFPVKSPDQLKPISMFHLHSSLSYYFVPVCCRYA
jgi:hypothetical protein